MLIKNHRLMTVRQRPSGADFGEIGYLPKKTATYLAFPKSLNRFCDKCVVGIKWDLVNVGKSDAKS